MADLKRHRIDVQRAIADGIAGRDEFFNQLVGLTPEQRAKVSPKLFSRLSEHQLRILLGGEQNDRLPRPANPMPPSKRHTRSRCRRGVPLPPLRTALAGALAVAALGGYIAFAVVTSTPLFQGPLVRPINAGVWPNCPRLDRQTDGCVYTVRKAINLSEAATYLAVPIAVLQRANPAIPNPTSTLWAPTRLIVWRGQGALTK